jgi:hypothetical protein
MSFISNESTIALQRAGMLATSFDNNNALVLFHSISIACFNSSIVCANRLSTRLFMSIGLTYPEYGGTSIH